MLWRKEVFKTRQAKKTEPVLEGVAAVPCCVDEVSGKVEANMDCLPGRRGGGREGDKNTPGVGDVGELLCPLKDVLLRVELDSHKGIFLGLNQYCSTL